MEEIIYIYIYTHTIIITFFDGLHVSVFFHMFYFIVCSALDLFVLGTSTWSRCAYRTGKHGQDMISIDFPQLPINIRQPQSIVMQYFSVGFVLSKYFNDVTNTVNHT